MGRFPEPGVDEKMTNAGKPFFSIITSTLNVIKTLERCVSSVASQTFRNYEHIIVDGASTDGTFEFLNSKKELFSVLISEPDTGIYNAWNKALKHVRGEWVLFLGADDVLSDNNVLYDVFDFIKIKNVASGIVYGNLTLVCKTSSKRKLMLKVHPIQIGQRTRFMLKPHLPPHPSTFHHAHLFKKKCFDESYKIAADSKMLIELLMIDNVPPHYFDRVINHMTSGGLSSPNGFQIAKERVRVMRELGLPYSRINAAWSFIKAFQKLFIARII